MIEVRKQVQTFGVAFDAEREEFQIAARNDFYAGYRTMTTGRAMDLMFSSDEPTNVFDAFIASEAMKALENGALDSSDNVLVVSFEVTLDYDTVQPSYTRMKGFKFVGSKLEKREE